MQGLVFLVWALGFWPALLLVEYFWVHIPGHTNLIGSETTLLLIIWIVGMIHTFRLYRWNAGLKYSSEVDEEHDAMYIVEAPNHEQSRLAATDGLESTVSLTSPPAIGKRLVLNADDENDGVVIMGVVEEVAEVPSGASASERWRIWIRLDRAEDFQELGNSEGWSEAENKRRSTNPLPNAFVRP